MINIKEVYALRSKTRVLGTFTFNKLRMRGIAMINITFTFNKLRMRGIAMINIKEVYALRSKTRVLGTFTLNRIHPGAGNTNKPMTLEK